MPESWGLCTTCEAFLSRANLDQSKGEQFDAFPPEWMDEFKQTSATILNISERFGSKVLLRIYDPRSFPGIFKAIRYRAFKHPTFIIGGKQKVVGHDEELINRYILDAINRQGQE